MSNTKKIIERMGLDESQKRILSDISGNIGKKKMTKLINDIVITTPWSNWEFRLGGMREEDVDRLSDTAIEEFKKKFEIAIFRELFGERRKLTPVTKVWLEELTEWAGSEGKALSLLRTALGAGFDLKSYEFYICSSKE